MEAIEIDPEKIGWQALQKILRSLIKAINRIVPLKGDGIFLHETEHGIIISTHPFPGDSDSSSAQQGNAPSKVFIQQTQWKEVMLVDPATCQQSTTYFLEFIPDATFETQFNVTVNKDGTWTLATPSIN